MATLSFWILRSLSFHDNIRSSSSSSLLLLLLLLLSIIPTVNAFLGFHPTPKSSLLLTKSSSSSSSPPPPIIISLQKYNHVRLVVASAFQDGANSHDVIIQDDNNNNDNNNDNNSSNNNDNKNDNNDCNSWDRISPPIATIQSPWVTIICERYRDNSNNNNNALLDYWRVEKDHSIVILTIYQDHFIFPKRQYRPGVDRKTLDFPGGRLTTTTAPTTPTTSTMLKDENAITTSTSTSTAALESAVLKILQKELHISANITTTTDSTIFECLFPLGSKSISSTSSSSLPTTSPSPPQIIGWPINSSFSNQCLYGYVAILKDTIQLDNDALHSKRYNIHNQNNDLYQLLDNDLPCLQCRAILMEWMLLQQRQGRQTEAARGE